MKGCNHTRGVLSFRWAVFFLLIQTLMGTAWIVPAALATDVVTLSANQSSGSPIGNSRGAPWGDARSPYTFGGGCASQGSWTQSALAQTDEILSTINQLKDNPACKGLETIVQGLQIAQSNFAFPKGQEGRADRLESIFGEISNLTSYLVSSPDMKDSLVKLLLNRTIEGTTLALDSTAAATVTADPALAAAQVAAQSLATRVQRATLTGMDALDQYFKALPRLQECLIGKPDQGTALIAAGIKLAAALAGSGEGVTTRLGDSIAGLVTMLRDRSFAVIRAKLDESQFWTSMSCLVETTSQAYCSAQDAYDLLYFSANQMRYARTEQESGKRFDNPLEGYYLLVREVPNIAQWLQKVQFGTTPKFQTDALFKNSVWENILDLEKSINNLRGVFNEEQLMLSSLTDKEAKKNKVLEMIGDIIKLMSNEHSGTENFYSLSVNSNLLPWYLIGRDKIPDALVPRDGNMNITIDWSRYMQNGNNGGYLPEFDDPDLLASRIEKRLESVIEQAQAKASAYFRQRLIVDTNYLVSDAVTDQNITVVTSLQHVYDYLDKLRNKVLTSPEGDIAIVPSISDTQLRIKKTLDAFGSLRELARQQAAKGSDGMDDSQLNSRIQEGYKNVIQVAFDQFNVLLQRDTLLTVRLSTFVREDFAMRVRAKENMTEYDRNVLIVSGKNLLDRLVDIQRVNPAETELDLRQAQVINKRNLEAVEELFSDSLHQEMQELGAVASRPAEANPETAPGPAGLPHSTDMGLTQNSSQRPLPTESGWKRNNVPWWKFWEPHYDSVPLAADDKYGSFEQLKAKLCIQTLAFENRAKFIDLCRGTVLRSVFDDPRDPDTSSQRLSSSYDSYLRHYPPDRPTTGENICAFRDFERRNQVYWMTRDLDRSNASGL